MAGTVIDTAWRLVLVASPGPSFPRRVGALYSQQFCKILLTALMSLRHISRGFAVKLWPCLAKGQLPKLHTRVRFPSPAPILSSFSPKNFAAGFADFVRVLGHRFSGRGL
jgi:hypothetical protein